MLTAVLLTPARFPSALGGDCPGACAALGLEPFATNEARILRAGGPGWSMAARTDGIAFLLLDDEPGKVLPIGRGPRLPELLESLEGMAMRPAA